MGSAICLGVFIIVAGAACAFLSWEFLSATPGSRAGAAVMVFAGILLAALIAPRISKLRPWVRRTIAIVPLLTVLLLGASTMWPHVTYSRFGLTVYGVLPIAALDITVDSSGWLWFRDKAHLITSAEVEALLTERVGTVVIGSGWHQVAKVEEAVFRLPGITVHVLPTPEAFELFNRLVRESETVVLLAHTTC